MFEFFASIGKTLTMIFSFIGNLITSMVNAVTWTAQSVTASLSIVGFLPSVIGTCVVLTLLICILNRFTFGSGGG